MRHLVKDLMTRDVVTVAAREPYREVVALMDRHRVSVLPVVDERGRLVGVVSSSDLLLKQDLDGRGAWLGGGRRLVR
jgi:CBS domain-containing protein